MFLSSNIVHVVKFIKNSKIYAHLFSIIVCFSSHEMLASRRKQVCVLIRNINYVFFYSQF